MLKVNLLRRKSITASLLLLLTTSVFAQDTTGQDEIIKLAPQSGVMVTGTIKDAISKKGLPGIRLKVEGFSAAITDSVGDFTLKVPSYTSTVIIEGEGYNSKRVPLKGKQTFNVSLLGEDHQSFNEVVNLPLGPKIKSEIVSSVGHYHVNSGWKEPTEMPDGILQGRIPGLNVIRRSGTPGVGANLFLRGLSFI